MKITTSQLRRIIREEIESSQATSLHEIFGFGKTNPKGFKLSLDIIVENDVILRRCKNDKEMYVSSIKDLTRDVPHIYGFDKSNGRIHGGRKDQVAFKITMSMSLPKDTSKKTDVNEILRDLGQQAEIAFKDVETNVNKINTAMKMKITDPEARDELNVFNTNPKFEYFYDDKSNKIEMQKLDKAFREAAESLTREDKDLVRL